MEMSLEAQDPGPAKSPASPTAEQSPPQQPVGRRSFLQWLGRGVCAVAISGIAGRVLLSKKRDEQPPGRWAWQIDSDKCTFCGACATACIRKPSAVKCVVDQTICGNCVVCYGHIYNLNASSDQIEAQGKVCPVNAVRRMYFAGGLDGYYLYDINFDKCTGCGACARECNKRGNKAMYLIIRPDICLDCNECAIVKACPSGAVKAVPLQGITDVREFKDR
jgi:electron transport complex protein RnfB